MLGKLLPTMGTICSVDPKFRVCTSITRFCSGWKVWTQAQVKQTTDRSQSVVPSVEEFIEMRRATVAGRMVEGT